jgi:hypothetical protein
MLDQICNILKNRVAQTGFFDKVGGLVQTQEQTDENEAGKFITKKYPVTADSDFVNCENGLVDMIPDDKLRGLVYFEGGSIVQGERRFSFGKQFTADVRLVAWLNRVKLGTAVDHPINAGVIAEIMRALGPQQIINQPPFMRLHVSSYRVLDSDPAIFAKYSYSNAERQYLMPPFAFFALDLRVNFVSRAECSTGPSPIPNFGIC